MRFFKKKILKRTKHSIATRLTWRVVLSMTIVYTIILLFVFFLIWAVGAGALMIYNQNVMDASNERISHIFDNVEVAMTNNVPEVEQFIGKEKFAYAAQENLLKLNPTIVGSTVAYNPDYEPMKGTLYSPYVWRNSQGMHRKQLTDEKYDYLHHEWYVEPVKTKKGIWSEPYIDEGGGDIPMITYSMPVFDKEKNVHAVQTADLALSWLQEVIQKTDSAFYAHNLFIVDSEVSKQGFSFILSDEGRIVVHSQANVPVGEHISDYLKKNKSKKVEKTVKKLMEDRGTYTTLRDSNNQIFVLYTAPITHTGWTIVTAGPLKRMLQPVTYMICIFLAMMIGGLIIVALVCHYAIKRLTKPITRFADSADEIAKGNFTAELPDIHSKDEMMLLHDSFETMQKSLIKQIEEVKTVNEEKGRIESELQIARNIQMSMLPKTFTTFKRNDIDIFGQLKPAREVGGDLYDFLIHKEKLYFCIGDVSGKGVPASLVMAVTRALFRAASNHSADPAKMMGNMNKILVEGNENLMFVTLFIGILDLNTGHILYSNAGHDSPLLIGNRGIGKLPCDANLPLGINSDWDFSLQEITIDPQTSIFMYTDGLTEAENGVHEQFQRQRIINVLQQSERKPKTLIEDMTNAVRDFVGNAEPSDDLTMLVIQYTHEEENQD